MLLDLRWALDKTAVTEAKMFKTALAEIAELCK